MVTAENQWDWNAHFVSFGVHGRNLYKFLRSDDKSNRKAKDYAPKFTTEGQTPPLGRWEQAIFHMAKARPSTSEDGKLGPGDVVTFAEWVECNFTGSLQKPTSLILPNGCRRPWIDYPPRCSQL